MIQANELRIGNYYDDNGQYEKVTPNVIEHVFISQRSWVKPIPITPEILEKAGFKIDSKHSYWNFKNKYGFFISMWMEDKPLAGFEKKGSFYWGDNLLEVNYLHQLQNLYFALTGEELEIDL